MMIGHGISVLLVTSAVGYWTLTAAGKEKGRVKALGQYLGFLIIVVSLLGATCRAYYAVKACRAGEMGGGMYGKRCPITGQPMGGAPTQ